MVPVLVGSALAARDDRVRLVPALAALWGAVFIQIGTNLVNDWGDYLRGADRDGRLGPPRVLEVGWLTPAEVRAGIVASFLLAAAAGVYLAWVAGPPVIAIGVASIAAETAYTAGPKPLAYSGIADLFVFLFFGWVAVGGTYFVQAGSLPPVVLAAAVPVGALATAILVVNNLRDIEGDRRSGKRTLAVRLGRRGGRIEYVALLSAAYVTPVALVLGGHAGIAALLPLATGPLAVREMRRVLTREDGPSLNRALVGTARLHALFGALFAAGVAIG